MDDVSWGALALSLTVLGGIYTWWALRHRGVTAAVRAAIPFAFNTLRLHRLEAACIPSNAGSIRLLENTGFKVQSCEVVGKLFCVDARCK